MGLCVEFGLKFGLFVIARFRKFRGTMIMDGFVVGLVSVVLQVLYQHYYVLRHMFLVLWIFLYCILLFGHLEVFYRLMMKTVQKTLQILYVLRLLGSLLVCV